ncbi:cytochrome c [Thiohalobacter thiocyanaticus]|uniref:Cytochrome c n=2 Tax=Thiohalobacter thiocyanaticus TaxID=585455 RepID=A0A426QJ69_9GAMM|nr:cytochrome c [Thiohalobacter thiocyanaticus]
MNTALRRYEGRNRRGGLLGVFMLSALAAGVQAEPSAARQGELRHLLEQDCGSCHGLTLKGGLGPALTQQAMQRLPEEMYVNTILDGRPGTPMPPWRGILTEDEVRWLVEGLRSGF